MPGDPSPSWDPCYVDPLEGIAFFDGITIKADPLSATVPQRVLPVFEEHVFACRAIRHLLTPGMRVLVTDAQSGVFAVWAAKQGCRVIATDPNPRAVGLIEENARANGVDAFVTALELDLTVPEETEALSRYFASDRAELVFLSPSFELPSDLLPVPPGFRLPRMPTIAPNDLPLSSGSVLVSLQWAEVGQIDASQKPADTTKEPSDERRHVSVCPVLIEPIPASRFYCTLFGPQPEIGPANGPALNLLLTVTGGPDNTLLGDRLVRRDPATRLAVDRQLVQTTPSPFTIPAASFFLEPGFGHLSSLDRDSDWLPEPFSKIPHPPEPFSKIPHPFVALTSYVERHSLLANGTLSAILVDTAPFHHVADPKDIPIQLAVWLPGQSQSELAQQILLAYGTSVAANTSIDLFLFNHPDRFSRPFEWNRLHCSTIGERPQLPTELPRDYFDGRLAAHRKNTSSSQTSDTVVEPQQNPCKPAFSIPAQASDLTLVYLESDARKIQARPDDAESVAREVDAAVANKRDFPWDSQGDRIRAQERHLALWEYVNHVRVRELLATFFSPHLESSRLVSIPLAFVPQPRPSSEDAVRTAPGETFRGVLWVWFFASSRWGRAQEVAADRIVRLLTLLYADAFHRWATSQLIDHDQELLTAALSHETKNLISSLASPNWCRQSALKTLAEAGDDRSAPPARPSSVSGSADATTVAVHFPRYFRAGLRALRTWFPSDDPTLLPFNFPGSPPLPMTFNALLEQCWLSTFEAAVAFGINSRLASEYIDFAFAEDVVAAAEAIYDAYKPAWPKADDCFPPLDWSTELGIRRTMALSRLLLLILREDVQHSESPLFPPTFLLTAGSQGVSTGRVVFTNQNWCPTEARKAHREAQYISTRFRDPAVHTEAIMLLKEGAQKFGQSRPLQTGGVPLGKRMGRRLLGKLLKRIDPEGRFESESANLGKQETSQDDPVWVQTFIFSPHRGGVQ